MVVETQVGEKWVCTHTMEGFFELYPQRDAYNWSCSIAVGRNYRRFAALAGVRGDGPDAKGVPADVSDTAQFFIDRWEGDGHSHSWLEITEAAKIFADTESLNTKFATENPESYFFNVDEPDLSERAYRIVFWFDN
jgi:hypothetical protein